LELYDRIDLALDTFPYNGTTTTCEALIMGVPVLTQQGDRHCARVGGSLISAIGMADEFYADNVTDYIQRAVNLASRRKYLSDLRPKLRDLFLASPVCDKSAFVRKLESAYRQMWREWCEGDHARYSLTPSLFEKELLELCEQS